MPTDSRILGIHGGSSSRELAIFESSRGKQISVFAASGYLTPVAGAISQEVIDVAAVLNAFRAVFPSKVMHDL